MIELVTMLSRFCVIKAQTYDQLKQHENTLAMNVVVILDEEISSKYGCVHHVLVRELQTSHHKQMRENAVCVYYEYN